MACIELPSVPPLPDILPLTLDLPPLPGLDLSIDFCCRLDLLSIPPIPLPSPVLLLLLIGVDVNPVEVAALFITINTYIKAANSVIDALPKSCPFE